MFLLYAKYLHKYEDRDRIFRILFVVGFKKWRKILTIPERSVKNNGAELLLF